MRSLGVASMWWLPELRELDSTEQRVAMKTMTGEHLSGSHPEVESQDLPAVVRAQKFHTQK